MILGISTLSDNVVKTRIDGKPSLDQLIACSMKFQNMLCEIHFQQVMYKKTCSGFNSNNNKWKWNTGTWRNVWSEMIFNLINCIAKTDKNNDFGKTTWSQSQLKLFCFVVTMNRLGFSYCFWMLLIYHVFVKIFRITYKCFGVTNFF